MWSWYKAAFHDTDTDTPTSSRRSSRGCRCRCRGMRPLTDFARVCVCCLDIYGWPCYIACVAEQRTCLPSVGANVYVESERFRWTGRLSARATHGADDGLASVGSVPTFDGRLSDLVVVASFVACLIRLSQRAPGEHAGRPAGRQAGTVVSLCVCVCGWSRWLRFGRLGLGWPLIFPCLPPSPPLASSVLYGSHTL